MRITHAAAAIIDYLHRAGEGEGERQAIVDYMTTVGGYSEKHVSRTLGELAGAGLLDRWQGHYRIDYESAEYTGEDWL